MERFLAIFIALSCFALSVRAEDGTYSDEIGLIAGELLPSQIKGITEVMPAWGLHYGIGLSFAELEFEGVSSHAWGADYYGLSGGLRGSAPLFPGASAIFFGGLNGTAYRGALSTSNSTKIGFHFGAGLTIHLFDGLSFRADTRLISGPGAILGVNIGLMYAL